jgi:EmrB/QacA subfamily drug resistance transporter
MSSRRVVAVTAGVLLGIFMASMEATVMATAMPTIVSVLGGLESYSWAFSGYLLTSTTTIPLYGKFSDLYGRRRMFIVAMVIFLAGSALCGLSQSMQQLIVFRVIQGIGAGGLLPVSIIIVGELFDYQRRARMQGLFAGVWGVSSVLGPLLGGFLVDSIGWQWVFYINILPGLLAGAIVWLAYPDAVRVQPAAVRVDYAGIGLLSSGVVALLLGLMDMERPAGWALMGVAAMLLAALLWVERRADDPILPPGLFRDRVFAVACLHGIFAGWAMFGSMAYVPLFVQAVLGTSATVAGSTLMPLMLSWVAASIIASRLMLRLRYRTLMLFGMSLFSVGAFLLATAGTHTTLPSLMFALGLMGIGMGFSIPVFLIVVQSAVARRWLGIATSTLQFSRNIGGTIGVSAMGAALSLWFGRGLATAGLSPDAVSLNSLIDPLAETAASSGALNEAVRAALAGAVQGVFIIGFIGALLALAATALAPSQNIAQIARQAQSAPEEPALHNPGQAHHPPTTPGP